MSEPVVVAILFADRLITEHNGKKGIIGVFNQFQAQAFPVSFPPWGIYIAMTNLQGKHEFALELTHEESEQVIIPIKGQLEVPSQNEVIDLIFNIENAIFPQPGRHILSVYVDGNIAGSRLLQVEKIPK